MKRWMWLGLWLIVGGGAPAVAAPLKPTDFARGIPLEIDGQGSVYELELPEAVYRGLAQGVDVDLRVFNGRGEVVPHALWLPAAVVRQQRKPVPLYPVTLPADDRASARVRLRVGDEGQVETVVEPKGAATATTPAWIVDLEAVKGTVAGICLEWREPATGLFVVQVDSGSDLEHWVLRRRAVLGLLQQGERRLERHCLELDANTDRYLRLRGRTGPLALQLIGAQALLRSTQLAPVVQFLAPRLLATTEAAAGTWDYRLPGPYPVVLARIDLPDDSLVEFRVASRPDAEAPWRERGRGLVYRLRSNGLWLTQSEIELQRSDDRDWRLAVASGSFGPQAPALMLGFRPHRLRFLARGPGPFTLAYGSARVSRSETDFEALLRQLRNVNGSALTVRRALAGTPVTLGGDRMLRPPVHLAWGRWILWAVLVLGVGVVALLVRSLYREVAGSKD